MGTEHDPSDTELPERNRKEADIFQRLVKAQEIADFKKLMSEEWGRRIVWRLLERAGVYRCSFTGNSETFFREGMRNIGLMYTADVHEHCPELYSKMIREAKANAKRLTDDAKQRNT